MASNNELYQTPDRVSFWGDKNTTPLVLSASYRLQLHQMNCKTTPCIITKILYTTLFTMKFKIKLMADNSATQILYFSFVCLIFSHRFYLMQTSIIDEKVRARCTLSSNDTVSLQSVQRFSRNLDCDANFQIYDTLVIIVSISLT